jgi:hypothetical protein
MSFGFYVYAFWIGSQLIKDGIKNYDGTPYDTRDVLIVLLGLITGMVLVMSIAPIL